MRLSTTVLGMLHDRGKQGVPIHDLYRQLYNPDLYLRAYTRIYSNEGAMTKGSTPETVDAMSMKKIHQIIDDLRHERYRWTPARRTYIPKKNGKKRPLGLPTWSDKLVQEVIRSLLEAYYEPQFSNASHGFRPGRGCHTALSSIQQTWTGCHWFIEGDIHACFDQLDHQVMVSILAQKIHDKRFLRLIKHLLQAGYLEEWRYQRTQSGTPQGGVVSPLLANIYLDQLDHYMETNLCPSYTQGTQRRHNPVYARLKEQAKRERKRGEYQQAKATKRLMQRYPAGDPNDPTYRRLTYVRYADDILLGFSGPKSEAEQIKSLLGTYLHDTLKLELSQEKTLITHAQTQAARFLGYQITAYHCDHQLAKDKRRRTNAKIGLRIPPDVVEKKRTLYKQGGKPVRRMTLASQDDYTIMNRYQVEYRGLVQYYQLASNVGWLDALRWDMQQSLLHTLAAKHQTRISVLLHRYQTTVATPYGKRRCLQVTVERGKEKKPLIARFGGLPLKRKKQAILVDATPTFYQAERKEITQRLRAHRCELCHLVGECEVHHIRKMADLDNYEEGRMPRWAYNMKKRRRKTLVVCQACHQTIHDG
jgi:group II intron reverse transcriptase/maturase